MFNKIEDFLTYWLPPILWMVLIFYLSSLESARISDQKILNFLFFKSLHVVAYSSLYFLTFRAFNTFKELSVKKIFIIAFFISFLYAIVDELHQTFVPTREGKIRDVFIDLAGISLMYIYIKGNLEFLKRKIL